MKGNRELALAKLSRELTASFSCWETLYQNGGSDPFWPDGVNLNLVRNHIIYYKHQMEDLLKENEESLTLFPIQYPDIYYRDTPGTVDPNFMAKADEIRSRANEQFALYNQDANFQYILAHHSEAFPKGETKATKQAGLSPGKTGGFYRFEKCILEDDLVSMRRNFREDYAKKAERWAVYANELRVYLSSDHSQDDTPIHTDFEDEPDDDICEEEALNDDLEAEVQLKEEPLKCTLSDQLEKAKERVSISHTSTHREDQLSLF